VKAAVLLGLLALGCSGHRSAGSTYAPTEAAEVSAPLCLSKPPPRLPVIDWVPAACPPTFGGCLTPKDAPELAEYLQKMKAWSAEAWRCLNAR
jgi:hypothetical protein